MAQELVLPRRGVTDGDTHDAHKVESVVEVIPPIGALAYIGGEQQSQAQFIPGILFFAVNDAFIPPVGQVICRGGPAHIVIDAKNRRVKFVV